MAAYGPPPDYREGQSFDCTGYTLPVFDTIWAGLNALGAAIAATTSDEDWQKKYGAEHRRKKRPFALSESHTKV